MTPDLFSTTTPTDDGPHPLPDGWRWLPFATVAQTRLGKMLDKRKNVGTPRRYLRNINVRWHEFDLGNLREMRVTDDEMDKYTVRKGDLVICEGGEPGRAAIWPHDEPMVYQKALHRARPRKGVDARFLLYVLEEAAATGRLAEHFTGSTINHLTGRELARVQVPLPPLDQQCAVVDALDALLTDLDHGVAALRDTRQRLDRYRQSVLQAAVEGRLTADWRRDHPHPEPAASLLALALDERRRQWEADQLAKYEAKGKTSPKNWQARYKPPAEPDPETLPDLPDGWTWATVDQAAAHEPRSITDGPFGSNLKTAHYTEDGPRVLRLQNIGDGEFIDEQAHISAEHFESLSKHHVDAGDLVVASLGEDLPRACTVPASVGPAIVKADCVRVKVNEALIDPALAQFALNAPPTRQRTARSIHGVGRPRLSLGKLREVALPVPPSEEQAAIIDAVEDRLATAEAVAREIDDQLARADAFRRSALRHAMRGALTAQAETA